MGLFSSIAKIAGVAAAPFTGGASLALSAAATAADVASTFITNSQMKDAAQDANNYSTQMSNTSYQRGVEDMKAAGLNPALAYSRGGASTPTGAQAAVSQMPQIGSRVQQTMSSAAQLENTQSNTVVQKTQAANNAANTARSAAETRSIMLDNETKAVFDPKERAYMNMLSQGTNSAAALGSMFIKPAAAGAKALMKSPMMNFKGYSTKNIIPNVKSLFGR